MKRLAWAPVALVFLAACGGQEQPPPEPPPPQPAPPEPPAKPPEPPPPPPAKPPEPSANGAPQGSLRGNAAAGALTCHFDTVNDKLMLHYPTGGAAASPAALADPVQGTATVDNHAAAQTVTARLAGANTLTTWLDATGLSDTPALAHTVSAPGNGVPGRGKELLAATDASTITVRVTATGF